MGLFLLKNTTAIIIGIISLIIAIFLAVIFLNTAFHVIRIQMEHSTQVIASYIYSLFSYYGNVCAGIANTNLPVREKKEIIKSFASNSPYIKAITIIDSTGTITYSYPDTTVIGKNISYQNHVKYLLKTHKPVVSSPIYTVQGYKAVAIHYPQFKNNKFIGSIAVLIPLEYISQTLQEIITNKTIAIITNENNNPIITIPQRHKSFSYIFSHKNNCNDQELKFKDLIFYKCEKITLPHGPTLFINLYINAYNSEPFKIAIVISIFLFAVPIIIFIFIITNAKYFWHIFNKEKDILKENSFLRGLKNSTLYHQEASPINKNILFNGLKLVALYYITNNKQTLPTNITYSNDISSTYIKGILFSPEKLYINFNNIMIRDILYSNREVEKFEFSHPSALWQEDNELYQRIFYTTLYIEKGTLYIIKKKTIKYGLLFLWSKNYKQRIKEWQEKMVIERIKKM